MSTPLDGYEFDSVLGPTFIVDLELDVSDLTVLSLNIEEMCWYYNDQGHRIDCPTGTDLKVLKDELKNELNSSEFHRGQIAEKHYARMEAMAESA